MVFNVPGIWILASLIGAAGWAMAIRWMFVDDGTPWKNMFISTPRRNGILRGMALEGLGLVLLVLTTPFPFLAVGLGIILVVGTGLGLVASRALRPPV